MESTIFASPATDSFPSMFVKAMVTRKKGLRPGDPLPCFETQRREMTVDQIRLNAYRALCGCEDNAALPILYPYVLSAGLQMYILTRKAFPLGAFGLVHTRNAVVMRRRIGATELLDAHCRTGASRVVKSGLEFDVHVTISTNDEIVWENVSTYLARGRFGEADPNPAKSVLPELQAAGNDLEMRVDKDMGRRYARVSGDYNPIHISSLLAKLFGFPRAIVHGMWSAAACAALMPKGEDQWPLRYDVLFKGPVFLGSRARVSSNSTENGHRFDLFCGKNPKPCLCGWLRTGAE